MGQLFGGGGGGLTVPNSALITPSGQPSFIGSPQQVVSRANAGLPSTADVMGTDVLHPQFNQSAVQNLPKIGTPSFLQAADTGPAGIPNAASPGLSKLGKLVTLLTGGAQGALAGLGAQDQMIAASGGRRAGGVGTGFTAGYSLPFLRAQQQQQVQMEQAQTQIAQSQARLYPQIAALGAGKTLSEIQKNTAEAGKAGAEAGEIPTKQALEQAQTVAAQWKEEPATGLLRNLSTGETMDPGAGGMAILDAPSAAVLGKQAGDRVPLKLALQAKQFVDAGVHPMQANGRSLLVDSTGKTIADKGTATPLVTMQAQLGAAGNTTSPDFQAAIDAVGQNKMDLQTALGRFGRFPGAAISFMGQLEQKYPGFAQQNYGAIKGVLDNFTSGSYSQNLNAIDTARRHMATFKDLAGDLNNGNVRAFNSLGNAIGVQFGSDAPTNFKIAKQFFSGEIGKAVVAGGGTGGERDQLAQSISTSSSWKQLSGAISTADKLLSGKQEALKNTFSSGMNATPNFGQGGNNGGNRPPLSSFEH